ncbi:MAG: hypothetical protein M1814_000098 [Vezdaea aestivalis]|nr:MAG: hypothetical protein M1814_000098 [Vezdaea aestivalis]
MIAVLLISFVLYSAFSQAGSPSIVNLISTAGNKDDGIKCVSHPPTGINYLDPSPWWLAEGRLNSLAEECYTNIGARCARIYDTKAFKHELLFNGIATHAGEWATSEMFIPPPNTYHDHLSDWATWLARNLRVIDICKIKCTCNDYTSLEYDETTILVAILDLSPDGLRVLPVPRHGGIRPIERDFASGYGAIAIPADVGLSRSESSSYGETLYWGATGSTSSEAFETGEVGLRAFQVVGQRQQSPYCDSVVIPDHVASAMVEVSATLGLEEPSERVWLPVPKFKSATQLCLHTVFGGHAEMNLGMDESVVRYSPYCAVWREEVHAV